MGLRERTERVWGFGVANQSNNDVPGNCYAQWYLSLQRQKPHPDRADTAGRDQSCSVRAHTPKGINFSVLHK